MTSWLVDNWFNLVQTLAILVTLALTRSTIRSSARATHAANELAIASANREVWGQLITNPQLATVFREKLDDGEEISGEEERFVLQFIQHLAAGYEILRIGGIPARHGVRRDIHDTMRAPVFQEVWTKYKVYQSPAFVEFVDGCIAGNDLTRPAGRGPSVGFRVVRSIRAAVQSRFSTHRRRSVR
jgi:hypothetical protein